MRILVVDDERKIADFIRRGLKEEHYSVDVCYDGESALYKAQTETYDIILLDLMLPDKDGLEVCRRLRALKINIPILMLTAKSDVSDRIGGLDSGADDYLVKPFAFEELLARVRALLRRESAQKQGVIKTGDLELNQITHKVSRSGKQISLTAREYALLEYLMLNAGKVVTRTMISEHVWDQSFESYTNVIDVHIAHLRVKIDGGFKLKLIQTLRGDGYTISIPGEN